jgi:hypothetical protein
MEIDNVQDTPQNANPGNADSAFDPVQANEGSSSEFSVDDIILGKTEAADEVFATPAQEPEVQPQPEQPQQEVLAPPAPEQPVDPKNDDTRFQYWQSRAARLENQLKNAETQQMQAQQQQAAVPEAPAKEEFPAPPERPKKPRTFSREEAYSDGSSESARYLDEVDEWRDNMDEYNQLKHQYEIATVKEQMQAQEKSRQDEIQRRQAYAQQQKQVHDVKQYVQKSHGFTPEQANEFVTQMASPESITMDNLVQLWRFQQGQQTPQAAPAQPSQAFQQEKRASQVPSPMGVMPSAGGQTDGRSTTDQIMDKMIGDFNSKNPWDK